MSYSDLIDFLAEQVDGLLPQCKAVVFWSAGTELRSELTEAESAGWGPWFDQASDLSLDFILDGRVGDDLRRVWEEASASTESRASQLLHSAIICMSSPLAIALEPERSVGPWIEHALFPLIQEVSLDLFGDVAFPDDDELEEVVNDPRFQAGSDYLKSLCPWLHEHPSPRRDTLTDLLSRASALNGLRGGSV